MVADSDWCRADAVFQGTRSAPEHEPAHLVAHPLVVEHKLTDLIRELRTLPPALPAAGLLALVLRSRRAGGPDRVGRRTQVVRRHMGHHRGLAGGVGGFPRGAGRLPGRVVRGAGGRTGLRHRALAPRPGTRRFDRPARALVPGARLLEEVQDVLRAIGRPHGKKAMIGVQEGAAATHGDEPGIPVPGEDHRSFSPVPSWEEMMDKPPDAGQAKRVWITVSETPTSMTPTPTQSYVIPLSGELITPHDLNDDGKYEDVNGNGRKDFADIVLYFNQMTWIAANEPVTAFDYNGNSLIDFADVVWLFNHIRK